MKRGRTSTNDAERSGRPNEAVIPENIKKNPQIGYDHLFDNNHSPSSTNPLPLHFIPKSRKLNMLESVEIKKALHYKQNILNNQLDIENSPIIDILINLLTSEHPMLDLLLSFCVQL